MPKHQSETKKKGDSIEVEKVSVIVTIISALFTTPMTAIITTLITALCGLLIAAITIFGPHISKIFTPMPTLTPTPTLTPKPACFSSEDILVRFHILKDKDEIALLAPAEPVHLQSGLIVYLQAEISSISDKTLPNFECTWGNAGTFPTQGVLLHKTSCKVDYRSGNPEVTDTLSLQLSQQACPALAPYSFFILP